MVTTGEAMSSWLDKIVPAGILTNLGNKDRRSNIPVPQVRSGFV